MEQLQGIPIHHGIVEGQAFVKSDLIPTISKHENGEVNISQEIKLYHVAVSQIKKELSQTAHSKDKAHFSTLQKMTALYTSILKDPVFTKLVPKMIEEQHYSAAHAITEQLKIIEQEFAKIDDEYFSSRFEDFKSIGEKLIERLLGIQGLGQITTPKIIVANSISAAELLHIPAHNILGLVVATGGSTSHAAILAESMGIPSVFGVKKGISHIAPYDNIIVDGYEGILIFNPDQQTSEYYTKLKERHILYEQVISQDIVSRKHTCDGVPFTVMANVGNISEAPLINKHHADGIGLLRTETIVLMKDKLLDVNTQNQFYSQLFQHTGDLPITIRTLDLGGDKIISNSNFLNNDDLNYFFGFRSTRQFFVDPTDFKKQLEALFFAYEQNPNIRIMIPFITTLQEFIFFKKFISEEYCSRHPDAQKCPIPIGMMVEIPATAICIEDFMPHADFVSIGTNDLTQYVLATERNNSYVSSYLNSSHPAIFRLLRHIARTCAQYNVPVSICGEMGKTPYLTRAFLGLGITNLSVTPLHIPMIKYIAAHSDTKECQDIADKIFTFQYSDEIVDYLKNELEQFLNKQHTTFENCATESTIQAPQLHSE